MPWSRVLVVSLCGFLGVPPDPALDITYSVTDLGDLPGGEDSSCAYALNDQGQVVGWKSTPTAIRGFLWEAGVMTDLGDLPGGYDYSCAYSINVDGQVVGESTNDFSYRAFMWQNGVMMELEVEGPLVSARSINDHGQVVGHSYFGGFLWAGGVSTILGFAGQAYAINNSTTVVGYHFLSASGPYHAA